MTDAQREVAVAHRESARASAEARRAMAEARRSLNGMRMQVVMRDCKGGKGAETSMSTDENGRKVHKVVVCENGGVDEAEMRKTMLVALQAARQSIAAIDVRALTEEARGEALANVDRKIAELKAR
jgi:hypothetical protein